MNKKNGQVSGDRMQKQQFDTKTLRRRLSYMKDYKGQLIFVVVCILLSAIASAASALFLQSLIDDYITPLLTSSAPVFTQLLKVLVVIGAIYLIGVLATLFYNRIMVTIAQGTLKKIRDEMFEKMQRLPIRAFDTRTHGDIMSLYTNDTDTLRQMIAQSMAQLISSVFTIVAVLVCMLYVSFYLTLVAVLVMLLILQIVMVVTEKIGGFFLMQQKTLADVNGYVEEMVNGQKVIKVFCHEETAKKELAEKNRTWATAAASANGLRQLHDAYDECPWLCAVCHYCDIGRLYGNFRRYQHRFAGNGGADTWRNRFFPDAFPQFQQPHLSDFQPVQLHCDGAGRRFPHLCIHG